MTTDLAPTETPAPVSPGRGGLNLPMTVLRYVGLTLTAISTLGGVLGIGDSLLTGDTTAAKIGSLAFATGVAGFMALLTYTTPKRPEGV